MSAPANDRILIIDFGSQVTQLIARRVRESGVYCEIIPYNKADVILDSFAPKAIILSGGPASVIKSGTPRILPFSLVQPRVLANSELCCRPFCS